MQFIPLILVLITALITIIIGLVNEIEIILCLKNLSIVIILFYIIGNIVKKLLGLIIGMEKVNEELIEDIFFFKYFNMFIAIIKKFEVFRKHMLPSTKGHLKVFFHKTISPKNCT